MARPLRIEFAGALHHVTSRGNARAPIFLDDGDRRSFLRVLGSVADRYQWLCHAYCLMDSHYHLVVETPKPNLSRGMRQLNGLYTQRFNRRHERVGHVFQGRFKGILVERESHMLELARYVVLNPVRAGIVSAAELYRWSSLRQTIGLEAAPRWLSREAPLAAFGTMERYLAFVREGSGADSPWHSLKGVVLGSESFARKLGASQPKQAAQREVPRRERLALRVSLEDLLPPQAAADAALRAERIVRAIRDEGYSLAEVGRHLGLHYSTVSRICRGGQVLN